MLVQRSVHLVMWSLVSTCCKRDTWAQKSPADFTECWCNSLRVSESIMEAALSADKHRKKKEIYNRQHKIQYYFLRTSYYITDVFFS